MTRPEPAAILFMLNAYRYLPGGQNAYLVTKIILGKLGQQLVDTPAVLYV